MGAHFFMENTNLKQKLLAADTTQPRVLELIYQLVQNTGDRELNAQLIDLADAAARHHTAEKHQKEASAALNLYWRALHYAAKYDFDSYCLYLERYRPYEKKFYAPRRRLIKPMVEALQRLGDKEIYFLGISCPPRVGKLVSDDTPVLTRSGWKNHGDLKVGDEVITPSGEFTPVTHVFPKECANIRVHFSDGSYADVHENHEWLVYNRYAHKEQVLETKQMMSDFETGTPGKRGHRYMYQVPLKGFLRGDKKDLPVPPYVLGAWLGDGRNGNPDICGDRRDYRIVERIVKEGYPISWHTTHAKTGVEYYGFKGLRQDLQKLGMCYSRRRVPKCIPEEYMTASALQRLDLLAGLIDTDGCLKPNENRYQFTTAEPQLKEDFISLVSTFGWRCYVQEIQPSVSSSGVVGKRVYWNINFNPTIFIPCELNRKQMLNFSHQRRMAICGFERIDPKPGNCISVDGGLYCIGRRLIPTHNSTLCIFFMTWMMGRYPDDASVMSGHSDPLTNGFYSEVLAIISDDVTYAWREVFPDVPLVGNSAKYTTIDLNSQKRFPTLTCRSIEGTLTGAVEVGQHGVLYCDDMVKSLEEALNLNRLQKKYDAYLNTLRDRMLDGAVELMVGTRWSVFDILGKIQDQYGDDPAYEFLVMPALDPETDESNFDYDLPGLGFSTEYYHKMRNDIDPATWAAKYMGVPYIRDGLLYPEEDLRRYYDLPQEEPDAILAVCDTADSGKNYTFLPVAYVYGDDYYVEDCVCTMALPEAFVPACGQMLARHKVNRCRFESNKAGKEYAKGVQEIVRQLHGPTSITWKYTTVNKETKIIVQSSFVKEHFLFKDSSRYTPNSAYGKMMKMLTRYVVSGKNEFDDVPDGLAMLAQYVVGQRSNTIQIIPGF